MPVTAAPPAPLAIATVTRAMALSSVVALDGWTLDPPALPDDALAVPRTRQLARAPVVVRGPSVDCDRVGARLANAGRLRLAVPEDDEPPVATLEIAGDVATLVDELGQRTPVQLAGASRVAADAALDRLVDLVIDRAVARSLRTLEGAHGLPPEAAHVTWGTVVDGRLVARPADGVTLSLHDTIAVQVDNRATMEVFVHVFELGVSGRVSRLTSDSVTGVPIAPGHTWWLADRDARGLVGIAQGWPPGLTPDVPRREELIVIVTGAPADLGVLESGQRAARAALPVGGGLARLCAQLHDGGPRSVGAEVDDSYAMVRIGFWVDPRPAPREPEAQTGGPSDST